ncbi:hypothetical protein [Chitinophaga filiformis]|uniref:Uncharacterized protein n=1 Tax=Chitinophaga filiformis TaxID=104663 RepID=A0A1G8BGK3_CHIFI|nr:hypothetical protein [Chitinophaga filiformis]SDH32329.1 hypothetical protein SAMN04488121_11138 [Chitinophaga filiformis]
MTQFINPVDILNLAATDLTTIDDTSIKRAKKAVLAEIDLSDDGFFNYHGQQLTRADCERVIDELEQRDKLEFYHFIANNAALSKFLLNGDESFFTAFRHESIYKLPEFVRFISPYFATAYDSILWKAWQRKDGSFSQLIAIDPIVTPDDIETSCKTLRNDLVRQVEDVLVITDKVKDTTQEIDINAIMAQVEVLMDKERLNTLPPYFQEIRNKMAIALRNLSVEINNTRINLPVAKQLHQDILTLKIDGVAKETILKDYEVLLNIEQEQKAAKGDDPIVNQYLELIRLLSQIVEAAANPQTNVGGVKIWIDKNIDIAAISALDGKYKAIKYRLAIKLSTLGGNLWKHHRNKEAAYSYIEMAERIQGLEAETLELLSQAKFQIFSEDRSSVGEHDPDGSNEKTLKNMLWGAFAIIISLLLFKACS